MDFQPRVHDRGWVKRRPDGSFLDRLAAPTAALAYWMAVGLPVVYLAVLASGLEGRRGLGLFLALLVVHAVALFVGRNYTPGTGRTERA